MVPSPQIPVARPDYRPISSSVARPADGVHPAGARTTPSRRALSLTSGGDHRPRGVEGAARLVSGGDRSKPFGCMRLVLTETAVVRVGDLGFEAGWKRTDTEAVGRGPTSQSGLLRRARTG